ncbi:hypothetical protein ACFLUC_01940 [Chloroflexota bacterium]
MVYLDISSEAVQETDVDKYIQDRLTSFESNSIVRVRIHGSKSREIIQMLSAKRLRKLAPGDMVVTIAQERDRFVESPLI